MTQRLTDDEIRALREDVSGLLLTVAMRKAMLRLLDEIEERRRIDARRLADAEQAFREECEAAAKEPSKLLGDAPFVTVIDEHCEPMTKERWEQFTQRKAPPATWKPAGKDGGA